MLPNQSKIYRYKKIAKEALKTSKNFVTQLSFKIIPI